MPAQRIALLFAFSLFGSIAYGEVQELSNTEMTEAYIKDGAIVIKQKAIAPTPKKKLIIKAGPGEAPISEAEQVSIMIQGTTTQSSIINTELNRELTNRQLRDNEQNLNIQNLSIASPLTASQQAQQIYAQDLVRSGLGLSPEATITPEIMGQYLASFSGQTYGDTLGAHQTVNNNGIQFIVPTTSIQLETGVFPSGDNSMNINSTNQHLIFNLFFPKE